MASVRAPGSTSCSGSPTTAACASDSGLCITVNHFPQGTSQVEPERNGVAPGLEGRAKRAAPAWVLAVVKHLVEAMGGDARAESDVGRGSKLLFTLPAA